MNVTETIRWMIEMPGLILDAERVLDACILDDNARTQAELLIADGKRLYAELLMEAWPEANTLQPHDEAIRMNQISQDV